MRCLPAWRSRAALAAMLVAVAAQVTLLQDAAPAEIAFVKVRRP